MSSNNKSKWVTRKKPLTYSKLIKIQIKGVQGIQFVGQFNFSEIHLQAHNEKYQNKPEKQIFLTDIGELAFGLFIHYEPERKKWFELLMKYITKQNAIPMKTLIDKVRKDVGRDPAREPSSGFPKYWIVTPHGSTVDTHGNTSKIRHIQDGNLKKSQVRLLKSLGYDVFLKSNTTFQELKSMFANLEKW